jgi:hypothetical protein
MAHIPQGRGKSKVNGGYAHGELPACMPEYAGSAEPDFRPSTWWLRLRKINIRA